MSHCRTPAIVVLPDPPSLPSVVAFWVLWLGERLAPSGWCGGLMIVGASVWAAGRRRHS